MLPLFSNRFRVSRTATIVQVVFLHQEQRESAEIPVAHVVLTAEDAEELATLIIRLGVPTPDPIPN